MENFYTIEDVTEFLSQQNMGLWTGNIIDKKTFKPRKAKPTDFESELIHSFELIDLYDDKSFKDFEISNFKFAEIVYPTGKREAKNVSSLTMAWCDKLLENYGKVYAEALQNWCNENIQNIDNIITKSPKSLTPEKKTKLHNVRAFFSKLLSKAKNKIKETENLVSA